MDELKAIKQITKDEYFNLAQNGARVLFDYGEYRVLDGMKEDTQSYFLKNFETQSWYLLDLETCYNLVTIYYCGGYKPYLLECFDEIERSILQ
jgi:hypothetical protein